MADAVKTFDLAAPLDAAGGQQGLAPYDLAGTRRKKKRKKANKRGGGSAQTLRDYWTHHGHGGPTHFAGADAIKWGEPGDFDRCVALVSKHMSPEQAKGYCNLRHKEALGYYPAEHARMEKSEPYSRKPDETLQCPSCKKYNAPDARYCDQCGSKLPGPVTKGLVAGEARVETGPTGGQFTAGGGDQAQQGKPGGPPTSGGGGGGKSSIREKISQLRHQIATLEASIQALKKSQSHLHSRAGRTNTPRKPPTATGSPASKPGAPKPGTPPTASGKPPKSVAQQIADQEARVSKLRDEVKQLQGQLGSAKGIRNVREFGTGRFRTFQGELAEARTALAEGRMNDVLDCLGSARALAATPEQRTQLSALQESLARTQHGPEGVVEADLAKESSPQYTGGMANKVGPHGYSHGWIHVGGGAPNMHSHASDMSKDELLGHLTSEHGGGPQAPGRSVGRRVSGRASMIEHHEKMHEMLDRGSPGVEQGIAHGHHPKGGAEAGHARSAEDVNAEAGYLRRYGRQVRGEIPPTPQFGQQVARQLAALQRTDGLENAASRYNETELQAALDSGQLTQDLREWVQNELNAMQGGDPFE